MIDESWLADHWKSCCWWAEREDKSVPDYWHAWPRATIFIQFKMNTPTLSEKIPRLTYKAHILSVWRISTPPLVKETVLVYSLQWIMKLLQTENWAFCVGGKLLIHLWMLWNLYNINLMMMFKASMCSSSSATVDDSLSHLEYFTQLSM